MEFKFKSILDLLRSLPDEKACEEYLIKRRWGDKIISPFDPESKVYRLKDGKFKCKKTGKRFSCRVGTIFQDSNVPLQKWFIALYQFSSHKRGISSHQLAKDIDVTQDTAYFMLQRLRDAFEHPFYLSKMDGVVQIDETYVGGKNKNRHFDKKTKYIKENEDRELPDKTPVWGAIDAKGMVRCMVVPDTKKTTVQPLVNRVVREDSIVVTDDWKSYSGLSERYWHETVEHGKGQYMNENGFTTNKIESYWSHLKRTLNGTYIHVSPKHLQRYCNESTFRYNTRDMSVQERFDMVLQNCTGRLSYKDLVKDNKTRYDYN